MTIGLPVPMPSSNTYLELSPALSSSEDSQEKTYTLLKGSIIRTDSFLFLPLDSAPMCNADFREADPPQIFA